MSLFAARACIPSIFRRLLACCLLLVLSGGILAATSVTKTTYIGACVGFGGPQDLKRLTCSVSGQSLSCTYRRFGFNNLTGFESACTDGTGQTITSSATSANTLLSVQFPDSGVLFPTDRVCVTDSSNTPKCWNVNLAGSNPFMTMNMTANNDIDSDGVQNATDNCLTVLNSNQLNTDGDSEGNACDNDDDNDGVADTSDAFQLNAAASTDNDKDGKPDAWNAACDPSCQSSSGLTLDNDDDNDTVLDVNDNCPLNANDNQADLDNDGAGNACDTDDENDGQLDAVDTDDDNDGVPDVSDAYPLDPLYNADTDRDTLPDNWELARERNPDKADYVVPVSSGTHACAIDETGVKCWGSSNVNGQLNVPATLSHPYSVTTGNNWSCACDDNGSQCWGSGYPATPSCSVPTAGSTIGLLSQVQGSCFGGVGNVPKGYNASTQCSITAKGDLLCDTSGAYEIAPRIEPFIAYSCYWTVGQITGEDKTLAQGNNVRQLSQRCMLSDRGVECFSVQSAVGNASVVTWQASVAAWQASSSQPDLKIDSDGDGVLRPIDSNDLDVYVSGDIDGDGIVSAMDNCPSISNADQLNTDGDAKGNVCDDDKDNDGIPDISDSFPLDNTQAGDIDGDGIESLLDNCAYTVNADQINTDNDAQGNVCDADDDNDGVVDASDTFPLDAAETLDNDNDGIGNNSDTDDDNDGVLDVADNCLFYASVDQTDDDHDGIGNQCDSDSAGKLDVAFSLGAGANDTVYAVAPQADGKVLIGGLFTTMYNGTAINRIARLNSDGSLDTGFNPGTGANNTVLAIVPQTDGKVLIGGYFTMYNGTTINRIARLNSDGSLDASFNPGTGGNSGSVNTIALQADGKVLIGGAFTSYNGTASKYVARLNSDGSLDTSFNVGTGASSTVKAIALQADGKVLIGGEFYSYNGTTRYRVARLNSDGSLDSSFNTSVGVDSYVYSMALQADGKVLIGGIFITHNGTARNRIARLNSDGSLDASFNPGTGANNTVNTITLQADGKVLIGGLFTTYNDTTSKRVARLNSDGSLDIGFNSGSGASSDVQFMAQQADGKVLIGGNFTMYNGTTINRIARIHTGDADNDGVENAADNCSLVVNADQLDTDADRAGNVCDAFPLDASESVDTDGDGIGDNADLDDDGDNVPDYIDAEPLNPANANETLLPVNSNYRGGGIVERVSP